MADDIQGLPEGAVVKPIAPAAPANIEGLPEGAVVKPLGQSTETVRKPAAQPSSDPEIARLQTVARGEKDNTDPDYYPGEGAIARGATKAYRAMGGGALGDTDGEVKQRLKEIAQHPVDNTLAFGKGILDAQGELAHKAKDAWKNGDHVGAAAYALYYLMPGIGPSLAKAGEQMSSRDIAGGLGTMTGTAAPS